MLNLGATNIEALVEAMSDAVLALDQPGVIRLVNRRTTALFGYEGVDLVGQSVGVLVPEWFRCVHPEVGPGPVQGNVSVVGAGVVLTGRRRDGSQFPVDISATVIDTEDGPVVIAAMSDTTDRDMAQRLVAILESSQDAIIERSVDGSITDWNPAAQELYGYSYEEVIGKSITILSPEDRVEEIEVTLAMVRTGQSVKPVESVRVRKDGTRVSVSLAITPLRDAEGAVVGSYAIAHDLTDRKKAELYARRMAAIAESSNDMIVDATLEGVVTSWNPAAEQMFGISSREAIGQSALLIEPTDRGEEIKSILAMIGVGQPVGPYETVRRRSDGTEIFISFTLSPVKDADGAVVGISAIGRDLTESKRAEEAMGRMAAIVESSNDGVVGATLGGVVTSWNPAAERMLGIPSVSVLGKSLLDIAPEHRVVEIAALFAQVRRGQPTEPLERVRIRPDGTEAFLSLTISPVKDVDGAVVGVSAIIRDLTDRRRAEVEHQRMSAVFDSSSDAIVGGTPEGVITSWNPAAERLYGYSREDAIGKSVLLLTPEDHLEESRGVLAKAMAGQSVGPLETVRVRKDGTQAFVSLSVVPVKSPEGAVLGLTSIARDLTGERAARHEVAAWQRKALTLMEEVARCQRLGAMRELAKDIKLLDL